MTTESPKNLEASIAAKLLNISKTREEEYQLTLNHYATERFLARLTRSAHREQFVLKGAMLSSVWLHESYRPTRDMDLHVRESITKEQLITAIRDICESPAPGDGLRFDLESLRVENIREDGAHGGIRATMRVFLGRSRIGMQIDVGFGDAITPGPILITYPALLDEVGIQGVIAYPIETVIAEKLEAMVSIGNANSRVKDFYDIWMFARTLPFDYGKVSAAVRNTFSTRGTAIPVAAPEVMTTSFTESTTARERWSGFLRRTQISKVPEAFSDIVELIAAFAMPLFACATQDTPPRHWPPGGPWSRE